MHLRTARPIPHSCKHAHTSARTPSTAQSGALRAALDSSRADLAELEELRELRADVERKERQQAAIIEGQAKRLEELDKVYRDEVGGQKGRGVCLCVCQCDCVHVHVCVGGCVGLHVRVGD